ncbi:3-alpha domain-containing protein [Phenylobacterium aquaticum]|uniref:3-alpha domain-containing protein n=1 Tax=Phenylobacterium aquaticum TaxID=1763816 RepID=UPI001F5D9906|nr:3-alpha domain-containing protein [Phenylobacterium aquaticum]MCI3133147.1 hypothetical protein [Phenylobacterium aquaticum]
MMNAAECDAKVSSLVRRADEAGSYAEMLAIEALAAEWRDLAEFVRRQEALERKYGRLGR